MSDLISTSLTAVFSFIATNIDDLVINVLFFSQLHTPTTPKLRIRHIITGKYLGLSLLIFASLPGFLGGLLIPREWIGLLGLLPIALGLRMLVKNSHKVAEVQAVQPLTSHVPTDHRPGDWWSSILSLYTYKVGAVTVANGGDNIGIYLPLFANLTLVQLGITVVAFWVMMGLWCGLSFYLAQHPTVAKISTRYGHRLVPLFLIALGISILVKSGSYRLWSWQTAGLSQLPGGF